MASTAPKKANLAALVDELGTLEKEFAPLKFRFERMDVLRKLIREEYETVPGDQGAVVEGKSFFVAIGSKGLVKTINLVKLFKAVGPKVFVSMASVTLKALDEHAPAALAAAVVTQERTGTRAIKVFERAAS